MDNLSGCLTASLASKDENYDKQLIDEINSYIKPPRPVGSNDVYIRAMYIVSDQINSQGGCFAENELDRLAQLLIDSPVMVGHQRDSLPLARNFKALQVEVEGRPWVKSYFYWMKDSDGAEDLRKNIDGGIYKECSISFIFTLPECSICGKDIRECSHVPFQEYEVEPGHREIAHFKYRNIKKVLETSLVFRGAIPNTSITDELSPTGKNVTPPHQPITATHFFKLSESSDISTDKGSYGKAGISFGAADNFKPHKSIKSLYLLPYQPGISLRALKKGHNLEFESTLILPEKIRRHLAEMLSDTGLESFVIDAQLYAAKGKDRLNGLGLMQIIDSETNMHRLRLRLCDAQELNGVKCEGLFYGERLESLKSAFADNCRRDVEVRACNKYHRQEWKCNIAAVESNRYNFGVEVLSENFDGLLIRNILTEKQLVPAIIERIVSGSRTHLKCDMKVVADQSILSGMAFPRASGLEPGTIVLVTQSETSTNSRRASWSLVDIFPGCDSSNIVLSSCEVANKNDRLFCNHDGDLMRICFQEKKHWRAISVYHFSPKLFGIGRRFIADMTSEDALFGGYSDGEAISLQSVTRSGKLILLRLAETSTAFGDIVGMWLRPVLIDGVERYLFYADETIRLQAEL